MDETYRPHAHSHNKYELFFNNTYYDTRYITPQSEGVDVKALEADLKAAISGEVRFDPGSKATYSTDSGNYRQIPLGVVLPRTQEDIQRTVAICHRHKAPLVNRGGGTSLAGQTCNVAIVMDMSKYYNQVLELDIEAKTVKVQPGIVLDHMKAYTEKHGLTFGPDPSTHNHCTIGGMLGNNSCGVHSIMSAFYGYGAKMEHNITEMTVLTYDGIRMTVKPTSPEEFARIVAEGGRKAEIYTKLKTLVEKNARLIRERFPRIPRRVSGYNLVDLLPENGFNVASALIGTESTCVTILDATLKLMPTPKAKTLVVLGYPDLGESGSDVMEIMKFKPIGLEGIDDLLIRNMERKGYHTDHLTLLPGGNAWLLVEFGGDSKTQSDAKGREMMTRLKARKDPPTMSLFDDPEQEEMLWKIRESGLGATAWVPGDPITEEGWEDSAVPPDRIGDYLVALRDLFKKYGWDIPLYGHFGQGCVHCRVPFDLLTPEGLDQYKRFTEEAAKLVVSFGGSISGEHGDGQSKADLLHIMYGPELVEAFREFKEIWDPDWRMNPGKITQPYGQLRNLRTGAQYHPLEPKTHFHWPDDHDRFSRAALRCVGIGECRRSEGGTMCPSYRVTQEEEHSTRGRSRLLYEMLMGDVVDGWKDKHVKNALDLCLSCKGCKGDCPVNVDMATYKSEFLSSHYYKGRLRPRSAYAMGLIYWWGRLASIAPWLANFFTQTPGLSRISKWIAGLAPKRQIPAFAPQTFKHWFLKRRPLGTSRPWGDRLQPGQRLPVILWADTFNNNFFPDTLKAAVEVLEAAGFRVVVPKASLCCGRPLYDYGMLDTAIRLLRNILDNLREEIRNGVPVVGLEPSCVAVFRDELVNLFPKDEDALRLKTQTFTLAEFLEKKAPGFRIPPLTREALVHGHCHQKAIMKMTSEKTLYKKMQLNFKLVDSGCCGMAGSFGYEKGSHYDVSVAAGELVLLPAVRAASRDALIIADGFSCREQIIQQTGRKPLHTAEVLQLALRQGQTNLVLSTQPEHAK